MDYESVVDTLIRGSAELNKAKGEVNAVLGIATHILSNHPHIKEDPGVLYPSERGTWQFKLDEDKVVTQYWLGNPQKGTQTGQFLEKNALPFYSVKSVRAALADLVKALHEDPHTDFSRRAWPFIEAAPKLVDMKE